MSVIPLILMKSVLSYCLRVSAWMRPRKQKTATKQKNNDLLMIELDRNDKKWMYRRKEKVGYQVLCLYSFSL
jgi:hypothetical protein